MRYYVTYNVPWDEIEKDEEFRNKLLGRSHWRQEETIEENGLRVTVSVDERTASYISLRYTTEVRPNHGI